MVPLLGVRCHCPASDPKEALTMARMPALMVSDRSGHAATRVPKSGSVSARNDMQDDMSGLGVLVSVDGISLSVEGLASSIPVDPE